MALDFGVEIECLFPGRWDNIYARSQVTTRVATGIAQDIEIAGVPCSFEGYNHHRRNMWKVVTDMSVKPPAGYVGMEIVSPPLTDDGLPQIKKVCDLINSLGAKTNRSCGLHVHIGARHLGIPAMRRLAYLYMDHEDVIDSLLPPSRRQNNNNYCRSLRTNVIVPQLEAATSHEEIGAALLRDNAGQSGSRYTKLNFFAFGRHGTVEFRQHSGTVDYEKIVHWVSFCQKMVDIAAIEALAPVPPVTDMGLARKLEKIKVAAVIYNLAVRPQGVTPGEARAALGWTNTPRPHIDLDRLGVAWRIEGTRGRQKVYKVIPGTPATLDSLLQKLELEPGHRDFWQQRRAVLGTTDVPTDLAE